MPYYRFKLDGGSGYSMVHIKLSGKAAKNPPAPCAGQIEVEGVRMRCCCISTALCDWPNKHSASGTCDAPLCADHAVEVGPDKHYCPGHSRLAKFEAFA